VQSDLSFFDLFLQAGLVVQFVMAVLIAMSILSWALIFQRHKMLAQAKKTTNAFESRFWSGVDLAKLYKEVSAKGERKEGIENLFHAGFREFARLRSQQEADATAILNGSQRAMRVAHSREVDLLESNLSVLATIGSISPYIGLFGTVWGIMNAFISLSDVQQATLQAVAPGIAEALVATAMGLFAAIPAVMAYNRFAYRVELLDNTYVNFAEEFTSILQRQAAVVAPITPKGEKA